MVMNGGVRDALEIATPQQFAAANSGYRFFGFDSVADLLTEARHLAAISVDLDALEARLGERYQSLIPNDDTLSDGFETYLRHSPSDFAPLSAKDRLQT
jgi:hypothetical protein